MRNTPITRAGWLVAAGLLAIVFVWGAGDRLMAHVAYALESGRIQANSDELAGVQEVSRAFRLVANVVRPGVVQIQVRGAAVETDELEPLDERLEQLEEQFEQLQKRLREGDDEDVEAQREMMELLREFLPLRNQREELLRKLHRGPGSGSGIILDRDGHILTNDHVVGERNEIHVRLFDEREYSARLIGSDPKTDLAVIKIEAPDLHALKFGDSDEMEVGDWVLAVGAPFGLTQSVTHGIISAKGRADIANMGNIQYQDFLQTDAAINPGNSGGPLVNLRGEVIGVNTAISTNGESYNMGIAFTIPAKMAARVAEQLVAHGEVARGWLGVSLSELTDEDDKPFGRGRNGGAMVDVLYEKSPAQQAGLRCEDIIVAVNGRPVRHVRDLRAEIADIAPGKETELKIVRDRQEQLVRVRLDKQPADINAFIADSRPIIARTVRPLGLSVRGMREDLPRTFVRAEGYRRLVNTAVQHLERRGVFVIEREDADENTQVKPGLLIVGCNGRSIASVHELLGALDADGSRTIKLEIVEPDGERRTVRVKRR